MESKPNMIRVQAAELHDFLDLLKLFQNKNSFTFEKSIRIALFSLIRNKGELHVSIPYGFLGW